MAGPVVNIGPQGGGRYSVDWGPRLRSQAMAWQGLNNILGGVKTGIDNRNKATLAEMFAGKADHNELVEYAGPRGLLPHLQQLLAARTALAGPPRERAKDAHGRLRYLDDGSFAFDDMADFAKDSRTEETRRVVEWLGRNPGKTEADYWTMKKGPGDTFNISNLSEYTKRYGSKPPPNHIWTGKEVANAKGQMIPELIPIGEAARKIETAETKAAAAQGQATRTAGLVSKHADRIRKLVQDSWFGVTGTMGAALMHLPGSDAHDTAKLLDSIKAMVGFDALNKMRAASPTGGALGSITERELGFLQATIASLEQSQSEEQFLENLQIVEDAFKTVIHGPEVTGNRAGVPALRPGTHQPTMPGQPLPGLALPAQTGPAPSPASVFDRMSIAELDGLNLSNMNMGALDALEAAYKRKKDAMLAGDYQAQGAR